MAKIRIPKKVADRIKVIKWALSLPKPEEWPDPNCGVYVITNIKTGKVYIGSSVNIHGRWNYHLTALRLGKHDNSYLQRSFIKYGEDRFRFLILEDCRREDLLEKEQYWMDLYQASKRRYGYNICPKAGSTSGITHSEEVRRRIGESHRGRKRSRYHRNRISRALKGRVFSEDWKRKLSEAWTPERRKQRSEYLKEYWESRRRDRMESKTS